MKKLRIEELQVESFPTTDVAAERGTVRGQEETEHTECVPLTYYEPTCTPYRTCESTCDWFETCAFSCDYYPTCPGYPTCYPYC